MTAPKPRASRPLPTRGPSVLVPGVEARKSGKRPAACAAGLALAVIWLSGGIAAAGSPPGSPKAASASDGAAEASKPTRAIRNVLIAISDDQSGPHTSVAGCRSVSTPAFDRLARAGLHFAQAYATSPGCSPSRASILTGRYPWELREAGTHASGFPADLVVLTDVLADAGYHVGCTGKGWGPGDWKVGGRTTSPTGSAYTKAKLATPRPAINRLDYASNFADFLDARGSDTTPFFFWYGATEPHRPFEPIEQADPERTAAPEDVPAFLPDRPEIRADLAAYFREIEHFDDHLGRMLDELDRRGELNNTLVLVTSDNGMAFPAAKANCYEYGTWVPLAVWHAGLSQLDSPSGRTIRQPVSLVSIMTTVLAFCQIPTTTDAGAMTLRGENLLRMADDTRDSESVRSSDPSEAVFFGRERHSSSRAANAGYPQRAIRTGQHLLIINHHPDRWPAGDPQILRPDGTPGPMHGAYHDIDACPTLDFLIAHRDEPDVAALFEHAVGKRPSVELFDVISDPACLHNRADDPAYQATRDALKARLMTELESTGDSRLSDDPEIWETYPRYSPIRRFPGDER